MMKTVKILLALSTAAFLNVAQAANNFTLAEAKLKNSGQATVRLDKCKKVDDIRIKTDKEIWLSKIVATFDSSKSANSKTYNIQTDIKKNGKSRWISLGNKQKCIIGLDIHADTHKGNASIEIQGRK